MDTVRTQIGRLWRASAPLTAVGAIMLIALVASLAAMAVDRTTILGAPTWLKPAKFAISSAIYAFTLAWIFTFLPNRRRLTTIVGRISAIVLVLAFNGRTFFPLAGAFFKSTNDCSAAVRASSRLAAGMGLVSSSFSSV